MGVLSDRDKRSQRKRRRQRRDAVRFCCGVIAFAVIISLGQASTDGVLNSVVDAAKSTLFNLVTWVATKCDVLRLRRLLKVFVITSTLTLWTIPSRQRAKPPETTVPQSTRPLPQQANSGQGTSAVAVPYAAPATQNESASS